MQSTKFIYQNYSERDLFKMQISWPHTEPMIRTSGVRSVNLGTTASEEVAQEPPSESLERRY